MKLPLLSVLALVVGTSAHAGARPDAVASLGAAPHVTGGTYTSPGGLSVAVGLRNFGGRTGVCGVWAESVSQSLMTKRRGSKVLSRGNVTIDGHTVLRGLDFLRKVGPARSYAGARAHCRITDLPWRTGRTVQVHIPRQVVYRDVDDIGSIVIWFRPGGPSAHPDDPKPWD